LGEVESTVGREVFSEEGGRTRRKKGESGSASPAAKPKGENGGSRTPEIKELFGLAMVDQGDPFSKSVELPAVEDKQAKKPAAKKGKAKRGNPNEIQPMISGLLAGIFAVLENKDPTWKVSDAEVNLISEPAARIVARMEMIGDNENVDYLVLLVGLITVCAPRLVQIQKKRRSANEPKSQVGENVRYGTQKPEPADLPATSAKNVLQGIQ